MTLARRPRVPWHAPATRRLGLLRIGLPTLAACVLAIAPGAAAQAQSAVPQQASALVRDATNAVSRMLDPPPGGHRPRFDGRPGHGGPER